MSSPHIRLLSQNQYDALDRLIRQTHTDTAARQRFYCKSRLTTELQGKLHYSFVQHEDQLLAQKKNLDNKHDITLLATDLQRSVLQTLEANHQRRHIAYTTYGHRIAESGLSSLLGFNGERPDPVTGHYLLGNGYRAFNPVLLRFNSPDSLSPFGRGGLNSYAYCLGDPINLTDPDGHNVFATVRAAVRWRRFAKAKIAARAELNSVRTTNTIQVYPFSPERFPLKAGVTPEQAIAVRNKANELDFLSELRRHNNGKFLADLDKAKRENRLLGDTLGTASIQDDRLKLLNYIKTGPMSKGSVMSLKRLDDAKRGVFDPQVRLQHRPRPDTAKAYSRELIGFMEESRARYFGSIYIEEAARIRELNFRTR